jgi:N-acyl-D-amino-acid deacylase
MRRRRRALVPWLVAAGAACAEGSPGTSIINARILDGSGGAAVSGTVRIVGDTIVAAGADVRAARGDTVIDAKGLVLAPGFIDTHSHHDGGLLAAGDARAAVSQGITTIVAGQDGGHPIPLSATLDSLSRAPAAVNVAFYAGHGSIREVVMGDDFRRAATPAEVDSMVALLQRELDAGALGLSTGLEYDPGIYSQRSEVLRLALVAAAAKGRYISHIRSEDRWFWDAIDEIITIGREAKLPVQISHVKLAMVPLWGMADSLKKTLDAARAAGVDVTADIYPYPYWQSTLTVLFPKRDFGNRREAEKVLREIARPEGLRLGAYAPEPGYAGLTVAEIAALRHEDPAVTLMALIRDAQQFRARRRAGTVDEQVMGPVETVIATSMDERDITAMMQWEHTNICSDGALDGAHPRGFGAFPRVLAKYVRAERALSLERAVRKMSALSASHMGIVRRGAIAPGNFADLVLFDPAAIQDRSTPDEPHLVSSGIARVWVNGSVVWDGANVSGARPGRVLRRQP